MIYEDPCWSFHIFSIVFCRSSVLNIFARCEPIVSTVRTYIVFHAFYEKDYSNVQNEAMERKIKWNIVL